jgi:predicted amidohydrolase
MKPYLCAAVQLNSTPDVDANLAQAEELISLAAARHASLIALPENFSFLGPEEEKVGRAEEIASRSLEFLYASARLHRTVILGGSFPAPAPGGKTSNRSVLTGPTGGLATYDKIHLFDVELPGQTLRESDTVEAGTEPTLYESEALGVLGMSICYDVRFPEQYRDLSRRGAEVLFIPAAFTKYTGQYHWDLLVRARAVENTCYTIAPAQCGSHFGKRESYGHSLIVDPWGTVLAEAGDDPTVITAEIDADRIRDVRRQIPSLRHRKM